MSPTRSKFQSQNITSASDNANLQPAAESRVHTPSSATVVAEGPDNQSQLVTRTLTKVVDPHTSSLRRQKSPSEQRPQNRQRHHSEHASEHRHQTKSLRDTPVRAETRVGTQKRPPSAESESRFTTSFQNPVTNLNVARRARTLTNQPDVVSSSRQCTPIQIPVDDSEFAILGTDGTQRRLVTSPVMEPIAEYPTSIPPTASRIPHDQHIRYLEHSTHPSSEEMQHSQVEVVAPQPLRRSRSPVPRQTHAVVTEISPQPALHVDAPPSAGS